MRRDAGLLLFAPNAGGGLHTAPAREARSPFAPARPRDARRRSDVTPHLSLRGAAIARRGNPVAHVSLRSGSGPGAALKLLFQRRFAFPSLSPRKRGEGRGEAQRSPAMLDQAGGCGTRRTCSTKSDMVYKPPP